MIDKPQTAKLEFPLLGGGIEAKNCNKGRLHSTSHFFMDYCELEVAETEFSGVCRASPST